MKIKDIVSRSWFVVFPNPEKHGYCGTPEEIIQKLKEEWIQDNPLKRGYWAYCLSAHGTPHIHMILENSCSMRFSTIQKAYPKPTKGSRKQVLAYIKKEPPFDEKGEQVIATVSHGNIEGRKKYTLTNANETLHLIEQLIEEGLTPSAIMAEDIRLRKEEQLIRKCYFAKRNKETPPIRDVKVIWHCGETGSGKSYSYVKLCEKYGDDNIYYFSDYANHGSCGFDGYNGEPILFLDELKSSSLPFELLLTITQGYRNQIHCRYANCFALWSEVHISSIFSPEDIYYNLVQKEAQGRDTLQQLLRRIDKYIYHYKEEDNYKDFELDASQYTGYDNLKALALSKKI